MGKTRKKWESREWWKKTARLYKPEEARRLQEEMLQGRSRLLAVLAERTNGAELVDTFRELLMNTYSFAHYTGVRRGYVIAFQLQKLERANHGGRAKAEIGRLIEKHPDWTTKQIFTKLDNEEIPLLWAGKRKPNVTVWWELADEPAYKMLVSRIRDKVRNKTRVRGWKKLMQMHGKLRSS